MPELPEVEVVRRGLRKHVVGRVLRTVRVFDARAARRQPGGVDELVGLLEGAIVEGVGRRGKFLWLDLADGVGPSGTALVVHLGMSGQMLVATGDVPPPRHLRIEADLGDGVRLRFVDQRLFGGWSVCGLVGEVPESVAHIARDPFDPRFDAAAVAERIRGSRRPVKVLLLDQGIVSGIGNIYADEALWRAGIHGMRPGSALTKRAVERLLGHAADVMRDALAQGGTSFDALYVDVEGESGYFARSLDVYGREGAPCARCGMPIRREAFRGRSSHSCPRCQTRPRAPRP